MYRFVVVYVHAKTRGSDNLERLGSSGTGAMAECTPYPPTGGPTLPDSIGSSKGSERQGHRREHED